MTISYLPGNVWRGPTYCLRRSLVMLTPHAPNGLDREKAIALVEELVEAEQGLSELRELVRLME